MFPGWRGLTLQTSGQGCLQAQVGQLGGCWGLWAAGASPLPSVSHVGRHSIINPVPPTGQCREGSVVHPPTCRSHPGQHRVPWPGDRACASPTASQQIHLCSSPSTTLPMSHLPCALAQTLTLPHPCPQSLIHSVCKEGDSTLPNQLSQRESSDFY